jgi:signal transduction histidine kinase
VQLRTGDVIRCGDTQMRVQALNPGAVATPVPESDPARLQAMGETVATISHSVKNILQGLRGGADAVELALRRGDLEMAREGWPIVARNLDRISWLVMNMLAYAKDRPLEIEESDIGAVVLEACELMKSTADRRGVQLLTHVDPSLPPAPIDANAVHQVLLNLLANAVEAAPERSGRVTVCCAFDAPHGVFRIDVSDDGAGVPIEQQSRLFEAFASTKGQRGTGLGLAVARALVERHGGTLTFAALAPHGTQMRAEFPADRGDPDSDRTRGPLPTREPDTEWDTVIQ